MKTMIKLSLYKIFFIITCKIPNLLSLFTITPYIQTMLNKNGIKNVKKYHFKYWHFGYKYFVGEYNNKKVFIKYNTNKKLIQNEIENMIYISNNTYLKNKIPTLYLNKELKIGSFLAEDFYTYHNIEDAIKRNQYIDLTKVFEDFINITKEFQKINFLHLDLNPKNVYIDEYSNIFMIDLGFSLIKNKSLSFIGSNRKKRFVIKHLNEYSRLDTGYIDDAISFITLSEYICPEFIKKYHKYWLDLNKLSNKLFFSCIR